MAQTKGEVTSIAINFHKLSFALDRKNSERFVLYNEAPNTEIIAPFSMASRSWMVSLLQTAFTSGKQLIVTHDDDRIVTQIELNDPLIIKDTPSQPIVTKLPGAPAQKVDPNK